MHMYVMRATAVFTLLLVSVAADAQTAPSSMDHAAHHTAAAQERPGTIPVMPGQDVFGAIQEIVRILEADPQTDWSRVDIDALREHLIDMNEVALRAKARVEPVEGGLRILVTGTGRTVEAIQRMLPAHAVEINGLDGWSVAATPVTNGAILTSRSEDPKQVVKIRGLGFLGIMVTGAHHQPHHLAMARGALRH